MRHAAVYLLAATLGSLMSATAVPAQMKATAPEKMMPADQAKKMRACEKQAMQQKIKMVDRTSFVANCMAKRN